MELKTQNTSHVPFPTACRSWKVGSFKPDAAWCLLLPWCHEGSKWSNSAGGSKLIVKNVASWLHLPCQVQHFPDVWHFSVFLVIFHCIENKNLTLWDFASYPPQGFRPARKKRQRDWDWSPGRWSHFAKGICSERHWRSFCNPLKYSGQILCKKITSTGLSMTNKKETQPKSGLQAARHLQGRGELQMFFCSCEACEDYRTAWLLRLLRVHIEKKSVWIGNLLRSTEAKL